MNRFATLAFVLLSPHLSAQITWISDCSDKTFCLNQGSCTEGNVFLTEKASSGCFGLINYSYRVDLFNDGNTDIISGDDTVSMAFAKGTHKIFWKATDNCSNVSTCSYLFTIKDCVGPNLLCISGLTRSLGLGCTAAFDVEDFIVNASDNCTPSAQLQFGIRKTGDGDGFPTQTSLSFDACELGNNPLEVWVKDENNFVNKCITKAEIEDNSDTCDCWLDADIILSGCARSAGGNRLKNYTVQADLASGAQQGNPVMTLEQYVEDSCYILAFKDLPINDSYQAVVRAWRGGDPLEGVSTFDLVQISKHILGLQPFQNLYQRLAADVNNSNSVTTFDIVETRKLILGIYDSFPKVPSWRLIRPLTDPQDFSGAVRDTYQVIINNLGADLTQSGLDFVGLKMGDVNLSATFAGDADDRTPLLLTADDRFLNAGEELAVPLRLAGAATLTGWQAALRIDPEFAIIESVEGLPESDFYVTKNGIRALWFDVAGKDFSESEIIFILKIKVLRAAILSEILTSGEERMSSEAYLPPDKGAKICRPLLLQLLPSSGPKVTFFPPCPNPFGNVTTFGIRMPHAAEVSLTVFDISGKRILDVNKEIPAGYQTLALPATQLPPGNRVLLYRLKAAGEVFSGRLMRL